MEAIEGYSVQVETKTYTNITAYAHTQSMGAVPLFTGHVDRDYYAEATESQTGGPDFEDIALEILFHHLDESLEEEVNVTHLGWVFTEVLRKLDGTTKVTELERKILESVTGSGIFVNILRENGSKVGNAGDKGTPRHRAMYELMERAYPGRPKYETDYEISYLNEEGKLVKETGLIDSLLEEIESLNAVVSPSDETIPPEAG